jgi:hypothetical protein
MPNNLELIIKDLYELDPTLRLEDKAVREVVTSLLANKPVVLPDQVFVENLRAKLLVTHSTKPVNERLIISPWLMYFAPIGVVAVLLLMMVPKPLSHQAVPTMTDEVSPFDSSADVRLESSSEATDSSRSFVAPKTTPADEMRTMEMALPVSETGDTFNIYEQLPGQLVRVYFASFVGPTFLVIQKDRQGYPGEVVGVSQVLNGQMEGFEIALMVKMLEGETFFATAYRDNGDGIYTPGKDALVYDASGVVPLQQMFSTSLF